jgi:hypothetical protein
MVVVDSLADVIGREYYHDTFPPIQARLAEVRERYPLE